MVGEGEPGHGASNVPASALGGTPSVFVPAELDLLEEDLDGLGRGVLHEDREGGALRQHSTSLRWRNLGCLRPGRHGGAARHQLLTWRAVVPVRRAKAAWLTPARASRAANSVPKSVCISTTYRTGFHKASVGVCRCGGLRAISAVIAPGGISRLPGHGAVADALELSRCLGSRDQAGSRHGDLRNRLQGSCDRRSWLLRLSGLRFVRRGEGQGARPARREGTTATKAPKSAEPE